MEKYLTSDVEVALELSSSSMPAGEYPTSEDGDLVEKALRKKAKEKKGTPMMMIVLDAADKAVVVTRIPWMKVEASDLYEKGIMAAKGRGGGDERGSHGAPNHGVCGRLRVGAQGVPIGWEAWSGRTEKQ